MQKPELEPIVVALIQRQAELQLSGNQFARLIGVTPACWSYIRNGKRRPGRDVLDLVLATFPDLSYPYAPELTISNGRVA